MTRANPNVSAGPKPDRNAARRTFFALLRHVWPADRPELKIRVALAVGALLIAKVITAIAPFFYKAAVDGLSTTPTAALVAVPVAMIVAIGVARVATVGFAQLRDALAARVVQNAVRRLALQTFDHIHALSLRFHLERRTGGLGRVIERGNRAVDVIIRFLMFNTVPTLVEILVVGAILAVYLDYRFSAVLLATIGLYVVFTAKVSDWRVHIRRQMNEADTDAYTKAVDSLLNYETVKYFGNERHEAARFDKSMRDFEDASVRTSVSLTVLNVGQTAIFTTGMTICMVMAGYGIAAGAMTVGDFVLVNAYFLQIYMPLNFLGTVHREIKQGLVDLEAIYDLQDQAPEIVDRPGAPDLAVAGGAIRFENVHFAYDSDRQILKGIDFEVPAGHTVAVVGPSGVGKSTLSRLLYRFYEADSGRILIDGQDITSVSQDSLRAAIGMVPQDTVLFNDTIGYNIAYGRPGADQQEIAEAARLAQIDVFVDGLPRGYDTMVGERGLKLSGGEKQRVAIARTILKGPPILILDEATSALDSFTERQIQSALTAVSEGRTTLVIAHRLSTVVDADEIIVLREGTIAERGRHEDLLKMEGLYASLWARQQETSGDAGNGAAGNGAADAIAAGAEIGPTGEADTGGLSLEPEFGDHGDGAPPADGMPVTDGVSASDRSPRAPLKDATDRQTS